MLDPETKGQRADDILGSDVFAEAVEGAKQRIKNEWASQASAEARERLWHRYQAVDEVVRELRAIRDNGVKLRHDREHRQRQENSK